MRYDPRDHPPAKWWTSLDERRMTATVDMGEDEEGKEETITVPFTYGVCPLCNGKGTHVNPSIDSHGLTSEDMEDEDFRETYFDGGYDVACAQCKGARVVPETTDERVLNREAERARYDYEDARTRWYEDGCPMD